MSQGPAGRGAVPISPPSWSGSILSVLCIGLSTNSVVLSLGCTLLESSGELHKVLMPGSPPPPDSYLIG